MKQHVRQLILSYVVIAYMLLAFAWWSVLLYTKNRDAFQAKAELLRIGMVAEQLYTTEEAFKATPPYQELSTKYERQEWMILGEVGVFIASLITGIWLINKSYNKEIQAELQRRNFLLSITHELKSPLASIQLILETFQKRELKREQVDKLSASGLQESERLNNLINNLLMAAKVEDAYKPVFEPLHADQVLRSIVDPIIQKHPGMQIECRIEPALPLMQADRLGLSIVFQNLIENAIKYAGQAGPIRMRFWSPQVQQLRFEIEDAGPGISDAEKKKVFERFYRVGSEETRQAKGTGLGLYIVQRIIEAHKGQILLSDCQPQGLRIDVLLPAM